MNFKPFPECEYKCTEGVGVIAHLHITWSLNFPQSNSNCKDRQNYQHNIGIRYNFAPFATISYQFQTNPTNLSQETQFLRKHWKSRKEGFRSRWKRHIVVNSMQARLRAQLGDWPEYSGERRRRSVVVASMVLTITDPLRGSYPLLCYLQAALIRPYGASFACMELTIISRFQRLQTSRKYSLHSLFL